MDGMEDDDDMTDGRHRLSVPWPPTILSSLMKLFVALFYNIIYHNLKPRKIHVLKILRIDT